MARIIQTLKRHSEHLNLPALVTWFVDEYPQLVMALKGLGIGVSAFAVYYCIKWLLKVLSRLIQSLRSANGEINVDLETGVNVNLKAGVSVDLEAVVNEEQEAEKEEELPTDDSPGIYAENNTITLVHKRIVGRTRLLQYRFRIENQHPDSNY